MEKFIIALDEIICGGLELIIPEIYGIIDENDINEINKELMPEYGWKGLILLQRIFH